MTDEDWEYLEHRFDHGLVQSTRVWYYQILPMSLRDKIDRDKMERVLTIYASQS